MSEIDCHLAMRGGMMMCRNMGSASACPTASASVPSASYMMRVLRRPYVLTARANVSRICCTSSQHRVHDGMTMMTNDSQSRTEHRSLARHEYLLLLQ